MRHEDLLKSSNDAEGEESSQGCPNGNDNVIMAHDDDAKNKTMKRDRQADDDDADDNRKEQSDEDDSDASMGYKEMKKKKRKVHKLSLDQTNDFNAALKRRGVIYVARIPPRMTPTKIKSLLQDFGEVTRVYLVEEDAAVRRRRRKLSGNGSKRYTEGWVEFASKKVAKHVAQALHMTPMSNYKRSHHYGDLWNLKYLHKFQWSFLTEKVAYERRVREQKLRLETMQARRETAAYKHLVETGQKLDKIQERKERRAQRVNQGQGSAGGGGAAAAAAAGGGHRDDATQRQGHERRKRPQLRPMDDDGTGQTSSRRPLLGSLV
jgi:ESF2/ABP1 family protein